MWGKKEKKKKKKKKEKEAAAAMNARNDLQEHAASYFL